MHLILAERYKDVELEFLRERKTDEIWVSMKSVHDGLGVKDMSDLVLKEIYDKYERKNLTGNDIKKFKMTEWKVFKKYDNLSANELDRKNNKEVYVINDVITEMVLLCIAGWKKEGKKLDEFRRKS